MGGVKSQWTSRETKVSVNITSKLQLPRLIVVWQQVVKAEVQ